MTIMNKSDKIYVAGHRGLVGSALIRNLQKKGYTNLLTRTHAELDLTDERAVAGFFKSEKPEYVFLAAAKVGGIHANNTYPAEFIHENLAIQINVIHHAYLNNVKRLLFLGSSCIYPKKCPEPIKEDYLLTSSLESTNRPYAIAKIAGIEMCWSYNRQFDTQYLAIMPCNLFGKEDNYHQENSHVIPALIRKFHEAKVNKSPTVDVWGTGTPKREFLYSEDLADACIYLANLPQNRFQSLLKDRQRPPLINVGYGTQITVAELAATIKNITGYDGQIVFDTNRPNGTHSKLLDSKYINDIGWKPKVSLIDGLQLSYQDFLDKEVI